MTLRTLTDALENDSRLKEVMVQQTETGYNHDTPIKKQGGDGREQVKKREAHFRVCLWTQAGRMIDEQKDTIHEAVHAAYENLGMTPPDAVTQAFPRPSTLDITPHDSSLTKPNWRAIEAATPKQTPKKK